MEIDLNIENPIEHHLALPVQHVLKKRLSHAFLNAITKYLFLLCGSFSVELINLSKGEATIYNFQNVAQKLSEYKLKSEYKTSGANDLPTITIRESETNKIVIYLRSKAEYVKDKKTGGKKLYYRNLVEKGQFLTELISTSALDNNVTSS